MRPRTVRPAAHRAVAVVATCVLLACGVLGIRHEADGAHVRDPLTGVMLHAQALLGTHVASTQADVHGRAADHDADGGECTLDAALHQAAVAAHAPAPCVAAAPAATASAAVLAARAIAIASVLRDAPKTSPPARA